MVHIVGVSNDNLNVLLLCTHKEDVQELPSVAMCNKTFSCCCKRITHSHSHALLVIKAHRVCIPRGADSPP